jgi:hypothetical protein
MVSTQSVGATITASSSVGLATVRAPGFRLRMKNSLNVLKPIRRNDVLSPIRIAGSAVHFGMVGCRFLGESRKFPPCRDESPWSSSIPGASADDPLAEWVPVIKPREFLDVIELIPLAASGSGSKWYQSSQKLARRSSNFFPFHGFTTLRGSATGLAYRGPGLSYSRMPDPWWRESPGCCRTSFSTLVLAAPQERPLPRQRMTRKRAHTPRLASVVFETRKSWNPPQTVFWATSNVRAVFIGPPYAA